MITGSTPNLFGRKPPFFTVSTIKLLGICTGDCQNPRTGKRGCENHYSSLQSHSRVQNVNLSNWGAYSLYIPKVFKRERFSCFETVKVCFEAAGNMKGTDPLPETYGWIDVAAENSTIYR
jgi:hypothetical protein